MVFFEPRSHYPVLLVAVDSWRVGLKIGRDAVGKQRAREKVVKFIRSLLVKYSTFSLFRCLSSSWRPFIFEPGAHPSSEIKETGPRERAITNRYSLFPRGGGGGEGRTTHGGPCVNILPSVFFYLQEPVPSQLFLESISSKEFNFRSPAFLPNLRT